MFALFRRTNSVRKAFCPKAPFFRPWLEPLEDRLAPATLNPGVTLITHGYNDDVSGWVDGMAHAIANQFPNSDETSIWTFTVTDSSPAPLLFHELVVTPHLD